MGTSFVELHVISDSTGETAARLVLALEAQFPDTEFEVVRHPRVESVDDLQLAVSRTADRPAVIVYTLVDTELRDTMRALCSRGGLHCSDLLGQPIEQVAIVSGSAAKMESGRRPPLDSHYFKRMAAIEFAVKYDDGIGAGLGDADIVLVGVSRTSKTPLSMYLGYLGHKVANVPIVRGIDPPKELFEIDRATIVGLTIDAERLPQIRQVRARLMRLSSALVLRAGRDLRGARAGGRGTPAARLSRRRRIRAVDRGDGAARPSARRASQGRERGADSVKQKEPVPLWRWATWWALLAPALVLFYVLFLPIWLGIRLVRLFAQARSRKITEA